MRRAEYIEDAQGVRDPFLAAGQHPEMLARIDTHPPDVGVVLRNVQLHTLRPATPPIVRFDISDFLHSTTPMFVSLLDHVPGDAVGFVCIDAVVPAVGDVRRPGGAATNIRRTLV